VKTEAPTALEFPELIRQVIEQLGEDPAREGLARTPQRVAKSLKDLTSGYRLDVDAVINGALFDVEYNEMVLVRDISFYSLCEHHMLPFWGKAHVAYIPDKKVIGLSKIPRLVNVFARRLQVQERMTKQIADTLMTKLKPLGVGVILNARHFCMEMRGAQSIESPTITSAMLGCFHQDKRTRDEFVSLVRGPRA
jgi:GTP cyclohydrolase IA